MSIGADETSSGANAPLSADERLAAFSQGAPKVPKRVIYWGLAVLLVLGVGGALLENVLSNAGIPSGSSTSPSAPPTTIGTSAPLLSAPLSAFMALQVEHQRAPSFSLQNAAGSTTTLRALRGRVVVLSFFDARCSDICPVVADEFRVADRALGSVSTGVAFATINVDPVSTSITDARLAGARSGLDELSNWQFLTGPLSTLNSLWSAYGIAVDYQPTTGAIAHSEYVYLIDPDGVIRYRLTPFANETKTGSYQLDQTSINRFGDGLATYITKLLK
jgi:cytochrome oxidase Cu insertion factor (SCO1/SenC/PrrC family)